MKLIRLKHITAAVTLGITLAGTVSCNKDFGDLNVNPNQAAQPSTKFLFGSAVLGMGGINNAAGGHLYVQHLAEYAYNNESRYFNREYSYNAIYSGPLMDLTKMIQLNTDPATKDTKAVQDNSPNDNQIGHARVLKGFLMLTMTDRWGDIPYFEALKGVTNTKPEFTPQREIYLDLLKEFKEASAQISQNMPNDAVFYNPENKLNNDYLKWKTWANTLRAIAALRLSGTSEAAAGRAAFTEAVAAGLMTSNADDAMFPYQAIAAFQSPWYANYINRYDYGVSNTLVDKMKLLGDPRLPIFARPPAAFPGTYVGVPYGMNEQYPTSEYSLIGTVPAAQGFPAPLTTYAQTCFMMAEAALIGWIPGGDAEMIAWYNKGIAASMNKWFGFAGLPITPENITLYATGPQVVLLPIQTTAQKLERIQTQKWLNFYLGNGYEAWAEWRRTGYPVLAPAPDAVNVGGQIPRRQCYIGTERDLNKANYEEALSRQGPDELSTPVWWDK